MTASPTSRRPDPELLDVSQLLAQTADNKVSARLLNQLGVALAASARTAGATAFASGRWIAGVVVDAAPHIPVRDLATLSEHHGGLTGEALADALVRQAMLATAGVGIAGGALVAVQWTVPMTLVTMPFQLVVESAAVASIEIKLVAELHEVYGVAVGGTTSQRGAAYAMSWAGRRGVNPLDPASVTTALGAVTRSRVQRRLVARAGRGIGTLAPLMAGAAYAMSWAGRRGVNPLDPASVTTALGAVTRSRVQRRLVARAGRGIGTLAPLMAGAAYGGLSNRRQTRSLSDALRADLRRSRPLSGGLGGLTMGKLMSALPAGESSVRSKRRPWSRSSPVASAQWPDG